MNKSNAIIKWIKLLIDWLKVDVEVMVVVIAAAVAAAAAASKLQLSAFKVNK